MTELTVDVSEQTLDEIESRVTGNDDREDVARHLINLGIKYERLREEQHQLDQHYQSFGP
ncbi:hypothetical protein [Natrinema halophilum]|uniref:hypothetical protein n=1 Tax=Natrinema halophilum TaxID=1699371 RepID=UPI001F468071|nr:hypothetical protein [Natrinema halophilum]UHQ96300.1 hypothetical protein HYG82_21825 [Natrinema halophilum]